MGLTVVEVNVTDREAYLALREMGLTLSRRGDMLWLEPKEAVTDEARSLARACKPGLLALLADRREAARLDRLHEDQEEMASFFSEAPSHPEGAFLATFWRDGRGKLHPTLETKRAFGLGCGGGG